MNHYLVIPLLLCLFNVHLVAQPEERAGAKQKKQFEPNNTLIISPSFTAQFPFGKMRDRFGYNNQVSLGLFYKLKKNWLIGGEGGFLFGNKVKEGYVTNYISTTQGQFISQDNRLLNVTPQERGFNIYFKFGKVVPFSEKYPDAGLLFITGFGFLQHKIALDARENLLPQLSKTYRKGYDRLCNGPAISQLIGGIFMERKKLYSFYGGFQVDVAFTQNRRAFDFFEQRKLDEKRVDLFLGVKLGWILPIYQQASEKEYYYY